MGIVFLATEQSEELAKFRVFAKGLRWSFFLCGLIGRCLEERRIGLCRLCLFWDVVPKDE